MGVGLPQSWTTALNLLQISAERGSSSARGQLVALAGAPTPDPAAASSNPWRALRRSIDTASWSRPAAHQLLCASPRIARYDQFISRPICDWIIARARGRIAPARVFNPLADGVLVEDVRSNGAFELRFDDMDVVIALLRFRIALSVGVHPGALESPQVLHYQSGQRFEQHFDFFDPDLPGHVKQLAEGGQRIVTCLVYLNSDFEGGETDFPVLRQRHKPAPGAALCFSNVDPSGTPDRRTLHAGLAPSEGEKWLFSQWIRERARP
jgi:hypothetical protein